MLFALTWGVMYACIPGFCFLFVVLVIMMRDAVCVMVPVCARFLRASASAFLIMHVYFLALA